METNEALKSGVCRNGGEELHYPLAGKSHNRVGPELNNLISGKGID